MYSQNDEQAVILDYFRNRMPGRFLDIGANDGRLFSNSLALIERGWSGVMVEPSPRPFSELMDNHGGNERLRLVNAAVDIGAEWKAFYASDANPDHGDMVGSLNLEHVEKWSTVATYRKYELRTVSVAELLRQFGSNFNFITLDVEGNSAELFFELVRCGASADCWCVEHDEQTDQIMQVAATLGLRQLAWNQENVIMAHGSP